MNAPANITTPALGSPLGGGFFAGVILLNGIRHAIIDAGKEGEFDGRWGEYGKRLDGARSFVDGLTNTNAMAEAGSELAQKIRALRIGDHDDWHIPAKDVLEVIYRNLKPTTEQNYCTYMDGYNANSETPGELYTEESPAQTGVEAYREGGQHAYPARWHWTSTQFSADYAFIQDFDDGYQGLDVKGNNLCARAVRLIPL